jgi:hypothetical protein
MLKTRPRAGLFCVRNMGKEEKCTFPKEADKIFRKIMPEDENPSGQKKKRIARLAMQAHFKIYIGFTRFIFFTD